MRTIYEILLVAFCLVVLVYLASIVTQVAMFTIEDVKDFIRRNKN